jgi:hypothetical protein
VSGDSSNISQSSLIGQLWPLEWEFGRTLFEKEKKKKKNTTKLQMFPELSARRL